MTAMTKFVVNADNQIKIPYKYSQGKSPGIIFLNGFGSNMEGNKARFLELVAAKHGHEFVRFDYSGHGESEKNFLDTCFSDWLHDSLMVLDEVMSSGPIVIVGSSMGGWIALHLILRRPERIAGFVGIAAAPDFLDRKLKSLGSNELNLLNQEGFLTWPSEYEGFNYSISKKMFDDGVQYNLLTPTATLLRKISCPTRLIHGTDDTSVPWEVSVEVLEKIGSSDAELYLVKDGDHRLSLPCHLKRIEAALIDLLGNMNTKA